MKPFNNMARANFLLRAYWSRLLKRVAGSVVLLPADVVVDFGAGEQLLKAFLRPGIGYLSCDSDKRFTSDIKSLSEIESADVVFASNVFEHLTELELRAACSEIHRLNPRLVVVAVPRETSWLNKLLNIIFNTDFEHAWEHKAGWKKIMRVLSDYFEPVSFESFYSLQWIFVMKLKHKGE